ncbi:GbsR/MarR family transcriptional regulator [Haloplanus aerogenes]|uniref:HTH-type transcriptional regulator n=1 Tax=Haloplanus aerogenes TaxID=660522 RepID=A0A3M0D447_9EURY|nr:MarR family transcriptional regulator [Haloplanus aerogenes]AZH24892.1 MarR family transcriptional regulator [Haloplanus aerogenes]RMB13899.1 DNA-binding transcriptional regulator GbsR (MarR family) [Haloplanus aerogenes]
MSGNEDAAEAVREDVIESMERSAEVYGLSRSAGRVYGVLYFAAEPLSIPELVEETGYAKSTISNVTRKLTRIGLIRRRSSGGGGRRVQFEPETDLWFVVQDVFQQFVAREMGTTRRTLDRAAGRLDESDADGTRDRIEDLAETYDEFERLLELAMDHSVDELIAAIEAYDEE